MRSQAVPVTDDCDKILCCTWISNSKFITGSKDGKVIHSLSVFDIDLIRIAAFVVGHGLQHPTGARATGSLCAGRGTFVPCVIGAAA
jgi:hypothetical protein